MADDVSSDGVSGRSAWIVALIVCIVVFSCVGFIAGGEYASTGSNASVVKYSYETKVLGTCVFDKSELYKNKPVPMGLECREEVYDCSNGDCVCVKKLS